MKNYLALKDLILNNLVFAKNIYNIETVPNKKNKELKILNLGLTV
tara:strand:+ start:208 stop:342 length:135 start_codon:yes stop_codon:yes gene_type:complete